MLEAPIRDIAHAPYLTATSQVTWTPEADDAFNELKQTLQITPTLGLSDPLKPSFVQTVDEKNGCMASVLLQKHGDKLRPVAHFSSKLDPVAAGLPPWLVC